MKYVFAGDRQISVNILSWMISIGYYPEALLVSEGINESHAEELIKISNLKVENIFYGNSFTQYAAIKKLKSIKADYFISVHFPFIVPREILNIPKIGFLNLHPAFLPYNKGWHTPSWSILDGTPFGATLHFMTEHLDQGDIIHQLHLNVDIDDTADTLYKKVLKLEEVVFKQAFDSLKSLNPIRIPQLNTGTSHFKKDLIKFQQIQISEYPGFDSLLIKLRALTTNNSSEAAYFIKNGKRIGIQVKLFYLDN